MTAMPDLYAVFGNPIAHSKSPQLHAEFARQTGENLRYEAILAPTDGFAQALAQFRERGGKGANVTLPFKLEAFGLASSRTERAEAAGAVNTLSFEGERLIGDNTDGAGLVRDIEHNLGYALRGKHVLVLGAGGAARGALLPLLAAQPAVVAIAARKAADAQALQARFGAHGEMHAGEYQRYRALQFDVVINATSASLSNELPPIAAGVFARGSLAYDMVYGKGGSTCFLDFARRHGAAVTADGIGMLVEQAAEAFLLWRGVRPDAGAAIRRFRAEQDNGAYDLIAAKSLSPDRTGAGLHRRPKTPGSPPSRG